MYARDRESSIMSGAPEPLNISIGNVPLRLHISDAGLYAAACRRYSKFLRGHLRPLRIFVRTDHDIGDQAMPAGPKPRFTYQWEGSSLRLGDDAAYFDSVRHEYGLDSLIRILLSVLLVTDRAFLLHAATVMRSGRAYVFTGKSGAGKSTVASLSPAGTVLTDEISLLRLLEGSWHAFGTPFWGEFRAEGANVKAPIAGLYVLSQSSENRIDRLSVSETLRCILPNTLFFSQEREMTKSLLHMLGRLVDSVPCYRLYFRKDPLFWNVLAA